MIEHKNLFGDKAKRIRDLIFSNAFAFSYINGGTTGMEFPGLAHTLVDRIDRSGDYDDNRILSEYWESHFGELFYKFAEAHNIKVKRVCRAAVNLVFHQLNELPYAGIHIDHYFPHYNFIYCVNDFDDGETYLFRTVKEGEHNILSSPQPINKVIKHEADKAICFSGDTFHANGFPKPGQWRCVFVATFTADGDPIGIKD
jgi:hypothetical protein